MPLRSILAAKKHNPVERDWFPGAQYAVGFTNTPPYVRYADTLDAAEEEARFLAQEQLMTAYVVQLSGVHHESGRSARGDVRATIVPKRKGRRNPQPWTITKHKLAYMIVRHTQELMGYGEKGQPIYVLVKEYADSLQGAKMRAKEWHHVTGDMVEVFDPNTDKVRFTAR